MNGRAEQFPIARLGFLVQGENMDLVTCPDEPLNQPQDYGDDPPGSRTIDAARDDERDLHRSITAS